MSRSDASDSARWRHRILLVTLLALAAASRFYRIGYQSFWNDEGTSVALASRSLALILEGASRDIHPPLYYLLLHGWIRLLGRSETAVRALSALLGVATVGGTYLLTERTWGHVTAVLAGLLAAVAPLQVYYAQEARMYMLAAALACASMGAWHGLHTNDVLSGGDWFRRSGLYLVATVLLAYTHYTGFTVVLAQNLSLLLWLACDTRRDWRQRRIVAARWAALQLVVGALYVPWLILSWSALTQWPAVGHAGGLASFVQSATQTLTLGIAVQPRDSLLGLGYAAGALALLGALAEIRRCKSRSLWSLYLLVPLGSMGLYSLARPMFKEKFALVVAPAFSALQAIGIWALVRLAKRHWGGLASLVLGVAAAAVPLATSGVVLWQQYHDPRAFRDDYRGIVAYIEAAASPDDAMLINAPSQIETIDLYASGQVPAYPLPLQRPLDQQATLEQLERIVARHARLYGVFWATDESDPNRFIESWLDRNAYRAMDAWFGNLRLVVYATPNEKASLTAHQLDCRVGDSILLERYALVRHVESGDILQVELTWSAQKPLAQRYKVFLHLLDTQGQIVAQRDAEPVGFSRPTDAWEVGETIVDRHGIVVRPGTPPGIYRLVAGMYVPETGQRLLVYCGDQPESDIVSLGEVTIERAVAPPPLSALDMSIQDNVMLQGVRLLGHSAYLAGHAHAPDTPLRPGDTLELVLYWQRIGDVVPADQATFELGDSRGHKQAFAIPIGTESYPPDAWTPKEIVRTVRRVQISQELQPGRLRLLIQHADGRWERIDRLTLATP